MKYAGLIMNDFAAAPGVSLTVYLQGCEQQCAGCHNPETWDFCGGHDFTSQTLDKIIQGLTANNIKRTLCIMGGEPLHERNLRLTWKIIKNVKAELPNTKIYIWTGYDYNNLVMSKSRRLKKILKYCNVLIDGPYIEELRDTTLPMRGSSNQRIIDIS